MNKVYLFKDYVDYRIGGLDNKFWYYIDYHSKKAEYYLGTYENGLWYDQFYQEKGGKLESKEVDSGITIQKIVERAYYYQDNIVGRKPQEIEKHGFICFHYMFGFGDKKDYGVTVEFNDIR